MRGGRRVRPRQSADAGRLRARGATSSRAARCWRAGGPGRPTRSRWAAGWRRPRPGAGRPARGRAGRAAASCGCGSSAWCRSSSADGRVAYASLAALRAAAPGAPGAVAVRPEAGVSAAELTRRLEARGLHVEANAGLAPAGAPFVDTIVALLRVVAVVTGWCAARSCCSRWSCWPASARRPSPSCAPAGPGRRRWSATLLGAALVLLLRRRAARLRARAAGLRADAVARRGALRRAAAAAVRRSSWSRARGVAGWRRSPRRPPARGWRGRRSSTCCETE